MGQKKKTTATTITVTTIKATLTLQLLQQIHANCAVFTNSKKYEKI